MSHTKKHTLAAAMQELQTAKHAISLDAAKSMVKEYKRFRNQLLWAKKNGVLTIPVPKLPNSLCPPAVDSVTRHPRSNAVQPPA